MFPAPLDEKPTRLAVSYDAWGDRCVKVFTDVFQAKHFYCRMFRLGRNPSLKKVKDDQDDD